MSNLAKKKDELLDEAVTEIKEAADTGNQQVSTASLSQEALDNALNSKDFSYDMNSDTLYNQYKEMYTEQGKKAAEHVYGLNTSLTGGYGNSYASSAASAAYGEYISKLAEKASELESRAYERYRDKISDSYKNEELKMEKENQEMKKQQLAADIKNDEISLAFKAAEAGDYSLLSSLGINTDTIKAERDLSSALKKAELGDYSALKQLGVDTSSVEYKNSLELAQALAKYGDYSGLDTLGNAQQRSTRKSTSECRIRRLFPA